MLKVLSIFGTRPEAIKMAPVVKELARYSDKIVSRVCVTAQHREMLDQVLNLFDIVPDYDLDLMRPNQSLAALTARVFTELDAVLAQEQPDWAAVRWIAPPPVAQFLSDLQYLGEMLLWQSLRSNKFPPTSGDRAAGGTGKRTGDVVRMCAWQYSRRQTRRIPVDGWGW